MLLIREFLVCIKPFQSKEWSWHKPKQWKKEKGNWEEIPGSPTQTQMGSRELCDLRQCIASSQEKCNLWPTCNLTMRKKIRQFSSPKETDKSYVYINWHPLLNFPCSWITRSPHTFCRVLTIMKKQIKIHQCKMNVCNTHTHLYRTSSGDIWIKQQLSVILSIIFLQSLRTFSDSE